MTGDPPRHNPDYLAKDYSSFRSLLFDHLAALAPESAPFEVASVESTLVETLAYVGDYLSYYQDAVATEAYLATARQRISVRRHARLVGYSTNEGCSARVWARIEVSADLVTLPKGTQLLTAIADLEPGRLPAGFDTADREVFETMHEAKLARSHNRMALEHRFVPSPGGTSALLSGLLPALSPGEVLVLRHRGAAFAHAVRLTATSVKAAEKATEIHWHDEDALPDALPSAGEWEVLGNIVLADHGRSDALLLPGDALGEKREIAVLCPHLAFTMPYRHEEAVNGSAAGVMVHDPRSAEPAIALAEDSPFLDDAAIDRLPRWTGRRDLVHSSQFDRAFAAEPAGAGIVNLRFGDGVHGRRLQGDWDYRVLYRTGIGTHGNIGPHTLAHIVSDDQRILAVSNPIAATGGYDPETLDDIRALAPVAADVQRRCVTECDYEERTRAFPGVRAALATRDWTSEGSVVTIHVCRLRDQGLEQAFSARLQARLASFQLIGDRLTILEADYVVPEVSLLLELDRAAVRESVFAAVREHLATMVFTFGETLDPQVLVARALEVPGVTAARVLRAARRGAASSALAPEPLDAGPTEVFRLDPNRIELVRELGK